MGQMKMLTSPPPLDGASFIDRCQEDVYTNDSESIGIPEFILHEVEDSSLMPETLGRITDSVYMMGRGDIVK